MTQETQREQPVDRTDSSVRLDADITFESLGVSADLVAILAAQEIISPFPIQSMTIPTALGGGDVCGKAKTGSGKTLAFGLPIIELVTKARPNQPSAIVLVPTRELANQVYEAMEPLAAERGLGIVAVYGGAPMKPQIDALQRGVEIVIATPGRLIDLQGRRHADLSAVEMVAIDEADQMADMGFLPQVHKIMRRVPDEHQTMLFSATLDGAVGALIRAYMTDPEFHEVASTSVTVSTQDFRFIKVHHMDKIRVAATIADSADRVLMFTRTRAGCDRVARDLREEGVAAIAIHGDLRQARREKALDQFATGKRPVLVATNVAARGLDIEGVDVVMHYDPPEDPKMFLHRSGRTARAGESGLVVTLVEWDQLNEVIRIMKQAGIDQEIVKMYSNDPRLADLESFEPQPMHRPSSRTRSRRPSGGRRRRRRR